MPRPSSSASAQLTGLTVQNMKSSAACEAPDPLARSVPLVVDLDGTLVRTDLLMESFFLLAKKKPLLVLGLPFWLAKGRAALKHRLAQEVIPDVTTLPYHRDLLTYLEAQKCQGRSLVLATGGDVQVAKEVALHLGLFDEVLASNGATNLTGDEKRRRLVAEFGQGGFDYAGDSRRDLPVWAEARQAILVGASPRLREAVRKSGKLGPAFEDRSSPLLTYLHALRAHHWLKNILVLAPLAALHQLNQFVLLAQTMLAFVAFSLCASSIYLFNDLVDLPGDRRDPNKRARPLASGDLPIGHALVLLPLLLLGAGAAGSLLPPLFMAILGIYWALMVAYCLKLKDLAIVDSLALGAGYALRMVAGAAAVEVCISARLVACCLLLFFSLALLKRYAEMIALWSREGARGRVRAYPVEHMHLIAAAGVALGFAAVLVLAIYVGEEQSQYARYQLIWLFCLLLLLWIGHIWLMAYRGRIHGDPVVFVLRDRASRGLALLMLAVLAAAA